MTDKRCVIVSTLRGDESDLPLFWSNDDGWVSLDCATLFSVAESLVVQLPQPASGWVTLPTLPPALRLADRITIGYDDEYLQGCVPVGSPKLTEEELVEVGFRWDREDTSAIAKALDDIVGFVIENRNKTVCPKCGEPFWTHNDDGSCVGLTDTMYECANCQYTAEPASLNDAVNLFERFTAGDTFTDKECPKCGALCFPVDEPHSPAQQPADNYGSLPVLGKFGDAVLDILQDDEDWNSDTFQKLNDAAFNLKLLSSTITSGSFVRKSINDIKALDTPSESLFSALLQAAELVLGHAIERGTASDDEGLFLDWQELADAINEAKKARP